MEKGKGWEFAEALGSARFSSPRIDVEKLDNIVVVAERVGLDGAELRTAVQYNKDFPD